MFTIKTQRDLQTAIHAFIKARESEKVAKAEKSALSESLLAYAEENDLSSLNSGDLILKVIRPKDRIVFDEDRFKAEHPELWAQYQVTKTGAKPSLR